MVSVVELKNMGGGRVDFFCSCVSIVSIFIFFVFGGFFFLLSASFCGDSMFHMLSIS